MSMNIVHVKVKQIGNGIIPVVKDENDACLDCYARLDKSVEIPVGKRTQIPLGFAMQFSNSFELQVRPRSGWSKEGIDVILGTGDSGYTGEYQATVINNTEKPFVIENGMKICQIGLRPVIHPCLEVVSELKETERGENGFGSSGVF